MFLSKLHVFPDHKISSNQDMKNRVQFNRVLLILLTTFFATEATVSLYNKIEQGQNITGKAKTQFRARSAQECSLRFVEFLVNFMDSKKKCMEITRAFTTWFLGGLSLHLNHLIA